MTKESKESKSKILSPSVQFHQNNHYDLVQNLQNYCCGPGKIVSEIRTIFQLNYSLGQIR